MFSALFGCCLSGKEDDSSEDEGSDRSSSSTTGTYITTEPYTGTQGESSRLSAGTTGTSGMSGIPSRPCPPGSGPPMNTAQTYSYAPTMMNQNGPYSPYGSPYPMGGYSRNSYGAAPSHGFSQSMMMPQAMNQSMSNSRPSFGGYGPPYGAPYGTPQSTMMQQRMTPSPMSYHPNYPAQAFSSIPRVQRSYHEYVVPRGPEYPTGLRIKTVNGTPSTDILSQPLCSYESFPGKTICFRALMPECFEIMDWKKHLFIEANQADTNRLSYRIANRENDLLFHVYEYDGGPGPNSNKTLTLRCFDNRGSEVAMLKRNQIRSLKNNANIITDSHIFLACNAKIGRIMDTEYGFDIFDGRHQLAFKIDSPELPETTRSPIFHYSDHKRRYRKRIVKSKDRNKYSVRVLSDLHAQHKILMMFATILIDYRYYEDRR